MMQKRFIWLFWLLSALVLRCWWSPVLSAQEPGGREVNPAPGVDAGAAEGKLSLDIKGMDIINVLKILAMRGNLNIVAGKNVRGKVTVFLKNVAVRDALEIILAANELAYEKKGDIINVMTERDYELLYGEKSYDRKDVRIIQLKYAPAGETGKTLNQIKSKIGKVIVDDGSNSVVLIDVPQKIAEMQQALKNIDLPTVTKTFVLNYAQAADLEDKIKEVLSKNIGKVTVDERMNKIIVTDLPQKMTYISRLVADFDERDKVVLIEAKIIQITLDKSVSYGINWNSVFAGVDTIASADLSVSLPSSVGSWPTTFTYTRARGATEYGDQVILKLLEKLGKTDVLSTPRITVANNQEAKVLVGTKEAYVTSTITQSNGTTTTADNVEFVDVGVRLSVTPTITEDGYVNMRIKPEVSSAPTTLQLTNSDGSVRTSVPIVTTSEAETQLLVKDGTTIILAGLMKDTRKDNVEKIPILGDIPLLGYFFTSKGKEGEKTETVIFLTPRIVQEGEDAYAQEQEFLQGHERAGIGADERPDFKKLMKSKNEEALSVLTEILAPPKDFTQYCKYISEQIERNLKGVKLDRIKDQTVRLSFMLSADGALKGKPQVLGPMNKKTKELISKRVQQAAPFRPFPEDYRRREESFLLTIYFE